VLPTFSGASFFPVEELHMIEEGLATDILDLLVANLTPKHNKFAYTHPPSDTNNPNFTAPDYTFHLEKDQVEAIGDAIEDNKPNIPSNFLGNWQNLVASRSGARAMDYADFMTYGIQNIVALMFEEDEVKEALLDISRAVELSLQWQLDDEDLNEIDRYSIILKKQLSNTMR
jgi:hypothetical protein